MATDELVTRFVYLSRPEDALLRQVVSEQKTTRLDFMRAAICDKLRPRPFSVGNDPKAAISALSETLGWADVREFQNQPVDDPAEHWMATFVVNDEPMRANGRHVIGGVVLDGYGIDYPDPNLSN